MPAPTTHPTDEDLAALPPSLQALARNGVVRSCKRNAMLIQEGDLSDSIYILLRGTVRVYASGETGREMTFGTYGPGDYVGEMSLDGGPRSANVSALEPVRFVQITRDALLDHLRHQPDFAFELLAKVIRRARAATLSARQLALNDVYGRLVHLLDSAATVQADGSRVVPQAMSQQQMAARLGASREMVGRLIRDLERGEYIARQPPGIVLLRPLPARW